MARFFQTVHGALTAPAPLSGVAMARRTARTGQDVDLEDIEDALCDLAGDLLPDSPGAAWDEEHAARLAADALRWLAEWFPECSGARPE